MTGEFKDGEGKVEHKKTDDNGQVEAVAEVFFIRELDPLDNLDQWDGSEEEGEPVGEDRLVEYEVESRDNLDVQTHLVGHLRQVDDAVAGVVVVVAAHV